jgi:ribonucleoside-diphosphate reductase subunit M1
MAASAPIQFTVDQEDLKVTDTNVARALPAKRRQPGFQQAGVGSASPAPAPQPMYATKTPNGVAEEVNGVPTPSATPPPATENKLPPTSNALASKPFKADVEEGDSPKLVAADALSKPVEEDATSKEKQSEDADEDSKERNDDIYAEAALACSIENPESCLMCSG